MHNGAVSQVRRRSGVLLSVVVLSAVVLSGCSEDPEPVSDPDPAPSAEPSDTSTPGSATASATPYLPVPAGVELTAQGTRLPLGDAAVVAYEPAQAVVGVLSIAVERVDKTSFAESFEGWKLGPQFKDMTPYFVRSAVTNEGDTDLGGRPVPLYAVGADDKLIEASTFKGTFEPCPSKPLPARFAKGDTRTSCQVFLVPTEVAFEAISFRPSQDFNPITWSGKVTTPQPDKPRKGKKGGRGAGEG